MSGHSTGRAGENPESEYKRVMERRRSRQSNRAQTNVDIDYVGDSARYEHIFRFREFTRGVPNPSVLNFGTQLRRYKCQNNFTPQEPFLYPAKKTFHPAYDIYENEKDKVYNSLSQQTRFADHSPQRNQNLVVAGKDFGIYENTFWSQTLRQDKSPGKKPPQEKQAEL